MSALTSVTPDLAARLEAESVWLRSLQACRCRDPILARFYLGAPSCARCGKLTTRRVP